MTTGVVSAVGLPVENPPVRDPSEVLGVETGVGTGKLSALLKVVLKPPVRDPSEVLEVGIGVSTVLEVEPTGSSVALEGEDEGP